MAEVLRRLGCEVTFGGAIAEHGTAPGIGHSARSPSTCPDQPGHEADYDLVRRLRASICVLGPLLARCGTVQRRPSGRRLDRLARPRHARLRAGQARRRHHQRARVRHRHGAVRPQGRRDLARLPERRRHREHPDGGGPRRGHHADRQRRARAGDRRHLPHADRDGRADRRRRHVHADRRGRRRTAAGAPPHRRRPDRRRHLGVRRGDDPRRGHRTRDQARTTWSSRWTRCCRPAAR